MREFQVRGVSFERMGGLGTKRHTVTSGAHLTQSAGGCARMAMGAARRMERRAKKAFMSAAAGRSFYKQVQVDAIYCFLSAKKNNVGIFFFYFVLLLGPPFLSPEDSWAF